MRARSALIGFHKINLPPSGANKYAVRLPTHGDLCVNRGREGGKLEVFAYCCRLVRCAGIAPGNVSII